MFGDVAVGFVVLPSICATAVVEKAMTLASSEV
jgi:hypothetical protein